MRLLALLLCLLPLSAHAQTYDPDSGLLSLPSVSVGSVSYSGVAVRLNRYEVVSVGTPAVSTAQFDPASSILELPTVAVSGGASYGNVRIRLLDFAVTAVDPAVAVSTPTRIYVNLVSHNEDTATGSNADCQAFFSGFDTLYDANNTAMETIASAAKARGATWNFQTDVEYLDKLLTRETAGSNVLRRLQADYPGTFEVDAHAHESFRKNYADVANRVEQVAGARNGIVGGYTALTCQPGSGGQPDWSKFRMPLAPASGFGTSFTASVLTLGASPGHGCDPNASGVWRPKSETEFYTDDPAQTLVAFGTGNPTKGLSEAAAALTDLVADYKAGRLQANRMYTFSVTIAQCNLHLADRGVTPAEVTAFFDAVNALDDDTDFIRWANYTRMLEIWKSEYGMQPSLWQRE